jgi:hypothetical protein
VALVVLATLPLACATPPEREPAAGCSTGDAESQLEIECARPEEEAEGWSEEALDEAREGMEERRPGGRP